MTYAVTGASGQLGRLVTTRLLAAVDPREVVLLTRDPARLSEAAEAGADVRAADFGRPASLPAAFAGVDRLLLISTDTVGDRVAGHRAAIEAAVAAGVSQISYTSVPEPDASNPAAVAVDHRETEDALRASGVAWTMLRNNLYADMQVQTLQQAAATGQLVTNTGDGAAAYVTREDCAAAAVGALLGRLADNAAYDVSGPQAVTADDLAALASEISGTPVQVIRVTDEEYVDGLVTGAGLPQPVAEMLASFGASTRVGKLAATTSVVEDASGDVPTALADVVRGALSER